MKKYIHKLLIASVAVLTLGVISPNHEFWTNLQPKSDARDTNHAGANNLQIGLGDDSYFAPGTALLDPPASEEDLLFAAREMSYKKFGSRIGPVIQNEFDSIIFPKIEQVIQLTLSDSDGLVSRRLAITETPSGNYAEKIFHVHDKDAEKDLIRFHVRTEKRPQDGYYYNFHYHTAKDDFVLHYSLGDIFWSKNTPPKWLS